MCDILRQERRIPMDQKQELIEELEELGFFGLGGGFGDKLIEACDALTRTRYAGDLNNIRVLKTISVADLIQANLNVTNKNFEV